MPVITVSRQPGSLASDITRIIAERLNLKLLSQETIHQMLANECEAQFKDGLKLYEKGVFSSVFERLMMDRPAYRALFAAFHYDLAAQGSVIIFGRGAQFAFKGFRSVLVTRIIASKEVRIDRLMARKNISENHARDFDDHTISKHSAVIKSIFNHDLDDPELYDCTLNTSHFNAEQAADILCHAIERKQANIDPQEEKAIFKRLAIGKKIETLLHREIDVPPHRTINVNFHEGGALELRGFVEKKRDIDEAINIAESYPMVSSVDCHLRSIHSPNLSS